MRINETTALATSRVLLVPYSKFHVPEYHEWMKDEDLQQATASEPLTLDEEYSMQASWRTDRDKLTFIACLPLEEASKDAITGGQDDCPERMIGDVNLFLVEDDEDDDTELANERRLIGEIEIMIARRDLHRQGLGRATLLAFMWYIQTHLEQILSEYAQGDASQDGTQTPQLSYLRVKIGHQNARSISLFESVGFVKQSEKPNYFGELELRLTLAGREPVSLSRLKGFEPPRILKYKERR